MTIEPSTTETEQFVDDINYREVTDLLRDLRKDLSFSLEEVGKATGASSQTVLNWENGYTSPRLTQVQKWARFLGVRLRMVIEDMNEEKTE